jgi:hypothetical protein
VTGNFAELVKQFDGNMKTALPAEKLQENWKIITSQAGAFKRQTGVRAEKASQYDIVYVTCEFEKTLVDFKVVFNSAKEIAGLYAVPAAAAMTPPSGSRVLEGAWQGTLQAGPSQLRLVLKFTKNADGTFSGTMDSIDQGARDLPISQITFKDPALQFEMSAIGASYTGTLNKEKTEISGQWSQGGATLPLAFKRSR